MPNPNTAETPGSTINAPAKGLIVAKEDGSTDVIPFYKIFCYPINSRNDPEEVTADSWYEALLCTLMLLQSGKYHTIECIYWINRTHMFRFNGFLEGLPGVPPA